MLLLLLLTLRTLLPSNCPSGIALRDRVARETGRPFFVWGYEMAERFERHRQPWRQDEIQKLHLLAGKGMGAITIPRIPRASGLRPAGEHRDHRLRPKLRLQRLA